MDSNNNVIFKEIHETIASAPYLSIYQSNISAFY